MLEYEELQHKITNDLLATKTHEADLLRQYKIDREKKDAAIRALGGLKEANKPLKIRRDFSESEEEKEQRFIRPS